eukprot:CAMPEP_0183309262 /NCGR_PEP_ID=MMETSP0160_2-20130417/24696_1 /TAXON_ID=2839 ORGANISM="Odontella Sinensis, Strain Grunow 1884" /NCGR_SAMPLE_ID=MMETSP0160_2 /ASSEMBLY_ACC=CAM_ASM_000250 /LENGTH=194 /DNA_ID=CAMNT_0025473261 /DNA_START=81 /DNA_END=665 /DNA_ORIENTATION=-
MTRPSALLLLLAVASASAAVASAAAASSGGPLAFLRRKKEYTPLLFFTAPKGEMAECDYMEKVVSDIEKELGMRAERFDIVRDRTSRILYDKIDSAGKQQMPMLYHRESRQVVYGPTDKNRVRAWAKGRWLSAGYRPTLPAEMYIIDEEREDGSGLAEGEEELLEDDSHLSARQKDGKEAMKRRLERGAKKRGE